MKALVLIITVMLTPNWNLLYRGQPLHVVRRKRHKPRHKIKLQGYTVIKRKTKSEIVLQRKINSNLNKVIVNLKMVPENLCCTVAFTQGGEEGSIHTLLYIQKDLCRSLLTVSTVTAMTTFLQQRRFHNDETRILFKKGFKIRLQMKLQVQFQMFIIKYKQLVLKLLCCLLTQRLKNRPQVLLVILHVYRMRAGRVN